MSDYFEMDAALLRQEKLRLQADYDAFAQRGLKLDMSRGKPSPAQLDLSNRLLSIYDYIDEDGVDARNYGGLEGLGEARRFFSSYLGAGEQETIVAGNSSLSLMFNMIDLGWRKGFPGSETPWKDCGSAKFLCIVPGYDRHFRITEEFGFELLSVPMTPDGPNMDVVESLVKDETVKGIWCIPVYTNPDGYVYSAETVRRLANMSPAAPDFRIFCDDAYHAHHWTDEPQSCPNFLNECRKAGCEDRVLMFCSTSKITFAGGGVSAMAASLANIDAAKQYLSTMTISFDKVNQLRHVRFLEQEGGIDAHIKKNLPLVAPKFQTVFETLREKLGNCGSIAHWTEPKGGYFISLYVMENCAGRVVDLCKQAGVTLTDTGAAYPYGVDPTDTHVRIAPSFPSIGDLRLATELLCISTRLASVEKLLSAKS